MLHSCGFHSGNDVLVTTENVRLSKANVGSEYGATKESVLERLFVVVALILPRETSPLRSVSSMTTESETKRLIAQNRL